MAFEGWEGVNEWGSLIRLVREWPRPLRFRLPRSISNLSSFF